MNIKALITTLAIVGSSSVAMARPATYTATAEAQWSFGYSTTPVVRDHRTTRPVVRPAPVLVSYERERWNNSRWDNDYSYQPRPQLLAADVMFLDNEYRKDILVGADKGRFNTITIAANGGQTYVMKVGVEFTDGAIQPIEINRTLRGAQKFSIDLAGSNRAISRIFVYRADGPAALNMNLRHHGEFLVTAL